MPMLFGMFVYIDFTSNVTRGLSSGLSFTFFNFLRKSCVSLTFEVKGGNQNIMNY